MSDQTKEKFGEEVNSMLGEKNFPWARGEEVNWLKVLMCWLKIFHILLFKKKFTDQKTKK